MQMVSTGNDKKRNIYDKVGCVQLWDTALGSVYKWCGTVLWDDRR